MGVRKCEEGLVIYFIEILQFILLRFVESAHFQSPGGLIDEATWGTPPEKRIFLSSNAQKKTFFQEVFP